MWNLSHLIVLPPKDAHTEAIFLALHLRPWAKRPANRDGAAGVSPAPSRNTRAGRTQKMPAIRPLHWFATLVIAGGATVRSPKP